MKTHFSGSECRAPNCRRVHVGEVIEAAERAGWFVASLSYPGSWRLVRKGSPNRCSCPAASHSEGPALYCRHLRGADEFDNDKHRRPTFPAAVSALCD